ncbi:unnamed protein product [Ostreobium quekettii]|uniref:Uncharacterized protein n=1 Tax=Ostreobium quekettii TaxID=121088 RepID=A0A8S1JCQ5_9CHLO|nr:unnamed protein product [Ostreobium quekettii]
MRDPTSPPSPRPHILRTHPRGLMALRPRVAAPPAGCRARRPDALARLCRALALALLFVAACAHHLIQSFTPWLAILAPRLAAALDVRAGMRGCRGSGGSHGVKPKAPSVVSIVVTETRPGRACWERIGDLIMWCARAGMRYVFVYDPRDTAWEVACRG